MKFATANRPFIQIRLWKYCLLRKRCFSADLGFFIVKRAWHISRYNCYIEPHVINDVKVQIEAASGKLIILVHHIGKFEVMDRPHKGRKD